jgi:hypothetical protein
MGFIDKIWNMEFLKGRRTDLFKALIFLWSSYQTIATSTDITQNAFDLPDIPSSVFGLVLAYLVERSLYFAKEHKPVK